MFQKCLHNLFLLSLKNYKKKFWLLKKKKTGLTKTTNQSKTSFSSLLFKNQFLLNTRFFLKTKNNRFRINCYNIVYLGLWINIVFFTLPYCYFLKVTPNPYFLSLVSKIIILIIFFPLHSLNIIDILSSFLNAFSLFRFFKKCINTIIYTCIVIVRSAIEKTIKLLNLLKKM